MISDRRLDRIPRRDEKSKQYPVRALIPEGAPASWCWAAGPVLDQGKEGACVGFAVCGEAAASPRPVAGVSDALAREVYNRARELDEWPGSEHDGSSVLAGLQAGCERGWYNEFRWALGPGADRAERDLARAIAGVGRGGKGRLGPAVLGIPWFESFYEPRRIGGRFVLEAAGELAGYHAIVDRAYSAKLEMHLLRNSWGPGYAEGGDVWVPRELMVRLLDEDGEAAIPIVRGKIPRRT